MSNIMINDLTDSVDLDKEAMAGLTGGHGYGSHHCRKRWHRRHHHRHNRWCKRYHRNYPYYKRRERNYGCHFGFYPQKQPV